MAHSFQLIHRLRPHTLHSLYRPNSSHSFPQYWRKFSTANNSNTPQLDDAKYNELSDSFLESLQEKLQVLETAGIDNFDVEYGHGVLTLHLGAKGTYVINKQSPNKQIWCSSPISGPKRFNIDLPTGCWVNNRDSTPLTELLEQELKTICNFNIKL